MNRRAEQGTAKSLQLNRLIGGDFELCKNPSFIDRRLSLFKVLYAKQDKEIQEIAARNDPISITLADGSIRSGIRFLTSPMDIAKTISKRLVEECIVANIRYITPIESNISVIETDFEECLTSNYDKDIQGWKLWDMTRPLETDCELKLLKFDTLEAKSVFWHSSAHILGQCMENEFGSLLTIGPALSPGFYYDSYMGNNSVSKDDYPIIEQCAKKVISEKQSFERLVCSKEEALELFQDNPFKLSLISSKVPENGKTTVYRCGNFIDLCMGPHVPHTGIIKAFKITKNSACNWLGCTENDSLQRVYGISYPDKKSLDDYIEFLEEVKKRDHRVIGSNLNLFFFDTNASVGSCFWLPPGARIYNKMIEFIRSEYRIRGFEEVVTPNIFSCDLWKTSGHYFAYKENMFLFEVEKKEWGLKPMNCPGHCIIFRHMNPSYKQLPIRMADFGVLHRNELSGALNGLTRVRRFQQDDAHIFCTAEQIQSEVFAALEFLFFVYDKLGFSFNLYLGTMPKEHLGTREKWEDAENSLKLALNRTGYQWKVNEGDGAFYGPKIDIMLWDALKRPHQCGTIQLDFQLPIRFNLQYRSDDNILTEGGDHNLDEELKPGYKRPVIIHRAILGSIERMVAVILENTGGKLPFWLSPRQAIVLPISEKSHDYAKSIESELCCMGYDVGADYSSSTINRKIREAQLLQWNFMLIVGENEAKSGSITVRSRDSSTSQRNMILSDLIAEFKLLGPPRSDKI
ncbi:threonyl-tRNA synthetase family protein [Cryptosporidium muris RN66]|uniref:Probable threonine--tRNA ligase, cytoplasmic n=1 Tax=Cryptosporidium muris (strain RN66) TaxID=441375 RepID=B6AFJ7_CRYMR|nr:threonyl-tRNA synthetase family protein [Cryptosporidium muris RN66]EEA06988.1 threonyl-tRNA synthetase family protein [Cryptosporidium muris RN66]|eukprot:XP_002141337.1 threonyl-tRNA synthetase family protein [Cryptosporidium muris RN66]